MGNGFFFVPVVIPGCKRKKRIEATVVCSNTCTTVCMIVLFYVQVFHFHVILAVQDLLCVWVHATGVSNHDGRDCVCHHRLYLLSTQL